MTAMMIRVTSANQSNRTGRNPCAKRNKTLLNATTTEIHGEALSEDGSINGVGKPMRRNPFPSCHIMPVRCFTCGRVVAGKLLRQFEQFTRKEGLDEYEALERMHRGKLPTCCRNMFISHEDIVVVQSHKGQMLM